MNPNDMERICRDCLYTLESKFDVDISTYMRLARDGECAMCSIPLGQHNKARLIR